MGGRVERDGMEKEVGLVLVPVLELGFAGLGLGLRGMNDEFHEDVEVLVAYRVVWALYMLSWRVDQVGEVVEVVSGVYLSSDAEKKWKMIEG